MAEVLFTGETPRGGITPGTGLGAGLSAVGEMLQQRKDREFASRLGEATLGAGGGRERFLELFRQGSQGQEGFSPEEVELFLKALGGMEAPPEIEAVKTTPGQQFVQVQGGEQVGSFTATGEAPVKLGPQFSRTTTDPATGAKTKELVLLDEAGTTIVATFLQGTVPLNMKQFDRAAVVRAAGQSLEGFDPTIRRMFERKTPQEAAIVAKREKVIQFTTSPDGSMDFRIGPEELRLGGASRLQEQTRDFLNEQEIGFREVQNMGRKLREAVSGNPSALALPGFLASATVSLSSQVKGVITLFKIGDRSVSEAELLAHVESGEEAKTILDRLASNWGLSGQDAAVIKGRIISFAYKVAQFSFGQTGRSLSDKDFENTLKRIGNSGSPEIFVAVIDDVIDEARFKADIQREVQTRAMSPGVLKELGLSGEPLPGLVSSPSPRPGTSPGVAVPTAAGGAPLPSAEEVSDWSLQAVQAFWDANQQTVLSDELYNALLRKLPSTRGK